MEHQSSTAASRQGGDFRRDHASIDAHSLALGKLTARRLCERPELLEVARNTLARWQRIGASNVQATLLEWEAILNAGLEETVATLSGSEERYTRLRQSSPFAGENIITRQERQALWREFAP